MWQHQGRRQPPRGRSAALCKCAAGAEHVFRPQPHVKRRGLLERGPEHMAPDSALGRTTAAHHTLLLSCAFILPRGHATASVLAVRRRRGAKERALCWRGCRRCKGSSSCRVSHPPPRRGSAYRHYPPHSPPLPGGLTASGHKETQKEGFQTFHIIPIKKSNHHTFHIILIKIIKVLFLACCMQTPRQHGIL